MESFQNLPEPSRTLVDLCGKSQWNTQTGQCQCIYPVKCVLTWGCCPVTRMDWHNMNSNKWTVCLITSINNHFVLLLKSLSYRESPQLFPKWPSKKEKKIPILYQVQSHYKIASCFSDQRMSTAHSFCRQVWKLWCVTDTPHPSPAMTIGSVQRLSCGMDTTPKKVSCPHFS